ncbi:BA14K family protein [Microvirga sp. CF3016]|uniref:BA14K family protein n=1 Tax=Microvirga sp. CF3016 TaxID=3110181 RepID=UPI002E77B2E1|nr:BA14K family protein [Microvirga sp. CF3016]MEE1613058.1 BA14K family protein [Microvirga sp. CF3016]
MRKFVLAAAATAVLSTLGFAAPASAAETRTMPIDQLAAAVRNGDLNVTYVQDYYRGRAIRRAYRGGGPRYVERRYYGPRRGYYGPRYGYYGPGYYRRDYGSAAAAGAIGLATGAIIGGAIAQSQAQAAPVYGSNTAAYCAQRYRSYDPASGTYLGYDGLRHPCP